MRNRIMGRGSFRGGERADGDVQLHWLEAAWHSHGDGALEAMRPRLLIVLLSLVMVLWSRGVAVVLVALLKRPLLSLRGALPEQSDEISQQHLPA